MPSLAGAGALCVCLTCESACTNGHKRFLGGGGGI